MKNRLRFYVDVTLKDEDTCSMTEITARLLLDDCITRIYQHPNVDRVEMKKHTGLFSHDM